MMRTPFICMPEPIHGESTVGFLLRFANANGYEGLHAFKWPLRALVGRIDLRKLTLMDLAESTGHHYELLKSRLGMSYEPEQDKYRYPFEVVSLVSKDAYNLVSPRICPECLRVNSHLRLIWDLPLMVACEEHCALLQDQCPQCREHLSWKRRHFDRCDCGLKLTEWKTEQADSYLLEFQWLVYRYRTTERFVQKRWIRKLPKGFVHLPIDRISRAVCRFIHHSLLLVERGKAGQELNTYGLRVSDTAAGARALLAFLKSDPAFCLQMLHLIALNRQPITLKRGKKLTSEQDMPLAAFRAQALKAAEQAFVLCEDEERSELC